jgi:predicted PhzF superfamily epimerase YddE/YHI9
VFHTRSGKLLARQEKGAIALDFPKVPVEPADPPEGISAILGAPVIYSGRTRFDVFIELPTAADVCDLDPDVTALAAIPARGIMVTAAADMPEYDFVCRFFAPAVGVPEDPVTGSAFCSLGPFWGERLKKTTLAGFQCSPRGGSVHTVLQGDRVILIGDATPILSGRLLA